MAKAGRFLRSHLGRRYLARFQLSGNAEFAGCCTKALLEGPVEGADGAVAAPERNAENRQLFGHQALRGLCQPVVVQKIVEIAETQTLVDESSHERTICARMQRRFT